MLNKRIFFKYVVKLFGEKRYLRAKYLYRTGKTLNLNNPKKFTEKLQWLKLNHRIPEMTVMADKILAKDFVAKRIGSEYVIGLKKIFESVNEIETVNLPKTPFVIKTSHDSGSIKVILEPSDINVEVIKHYFFSKMHNFYYMSLEWEYLNIKPKILIEDYVKSDDNIFLQDFKVHCFNGEPLLIQTISDRGSEVKENWFNTSWKPQEMSYFSDKKADVPKPVVLDEMIQVSTKLAQGLPYVRIDFYNNNGRLLFGEFTFRPYGGFMKWNREKIDYQLGELLFLENLNS